MRATFDINYYCRESKASKKTGLAPIELSIIINGRRVFINLPKKYAPEAFKREIKVKDSPINIWLKAMNDKVTIIQSEMMRHNIPVTADGLKEYIRTGGVKSYDLVTLFSEFLEEYRGRVTEKTISKYKIVMKLWKECSPNLNELNMVTLQDGKRFYKFLQDRYEQSTVSGMATKIKTIFKYAIDLGLIQTNPMGGIRIDKGEKEVDYLLEDELERIRVCRLPTPCYERVRDLFMFQAGTGMSYCDMAELTKDDVRIQNGTYYISKKRKKTDVEYTTILLSSAVDVWIKYKGKLPVISNQRYNTYLKVIQGIVGLNKSLHSHLARHTFACTALNRGIRLEIVSRALGHTNTRQTQHYARLNTNTTITELSKIF